MVVYLQNFKSLFIILWNRISNVAKTGLEILLILPLTLIQLLIQKYAFT